MELILKKNSLATLIENQLINVDLKHLWKH